MASTCSTLSSNQNEKTCCRNGSSTSFRKTPWRSLTSWTGSTGGASLSNERLSPSRSTLQPSDQCHRVHGDVIDHVLLINYFKALIAVMHKWALILNVVDNRHGQDAQRALLHVGVILTGLVVVNIAKLDLKHGNDCAEQVLHESFLLANQQWPGLQLGQRDVNCVDRRRHRIRDDPPLVRQHQVGPLVLGVLQERVAIQLVEIQQAAQVHLAICLLWALDVHGDD